MEQLNGEDLTMVREKIDEAKDAGLLDTLSQLDTKQKDTLDIAITSFLAGVNATLAATKLA